MRSGSRACSSCSRLLWAAFMAGALFTLIPFSVPAQSPSAQPSTSLPAMDAYFVQDPVTLDGLLNEAGWAQAKPATEFFQTDPIEGAPATEKTEVRVLYDNLNIYVGIRCLDSEPERIIHNELKFDANQGNDDSFIMVLDTFADQRNGFYFQVNPNGARRDGRHNGTATMNADWNGVWNTMAVITPEGWSAEMVIPLSTLRFADAENQTWGINFQRVIARKHEMALWTAWQRDYGITQLTQAGKLRNLKNLNRGRILEVKPYSLGGVENRLGDKDNQFKYGVDIKYPLTSELTLDFTSFTDFAQIEADRTQINLTRFDLRYPEKRDFFLEGTEIFEFGSGISTPF